MGEARPEATAVYLDTNARGLQEMVCQRRGSAGD